MINNTNPNHEDSQRLYSTDIIAGPICHLLSVNWDELLAWARPQLSEQSQPGFLLSAREYLLLWEEIIRLGNEPDVYRLLGQRMANGPTIPVLFSLSCAPNLMTGLERFSRYKHLFGPIRLKVQKSANHLTAGFYKSEQNVELPPSFSVPQIIFLHSKACLLSVDHIKPTRVTLPIGENERRKLADIFDRVPEYGNPQLIYDLEDVTQPFISENAALWEATEQDLLSHEKIISNGLSTTERVEAVLVANFGISEPTLPFVCNRLQISKSTLLRKLKAEDTTFKEILEKTRKQLVIRYLETSNLTNQQISHLVGYTDSNAFHRAFKQWTGLTLGQMRVKLQNV